MKTYASKMIRIPQQSRLNDHLSAAINDATTRVVTDRRTHRQTHTG